MALADYFQGPKHRAESERLAGLNANLERQVAQLSGELNAFKRMAQESNGFDLMTIQAQIADSKSKLSSIGAEVAAITARRDETQAELSSLQDQVLVVQETLLLESFALYRPKFDFATSEQFKDRLEKVRVHQKHMVKSAIATTGGSGWTVDGSATKGAKLVADMSKLLIRSFNNECDYCVDHVKFNNVEINAERIRKSFEACNRLGKMMGVSISEEYKDLKIDELHLAHEYQVKKQAEKEEAKRIREELREQQKLEQEIRAAREKIAKERKHFLAAAKDIQQRLDKAKDEEERQVLQARLDELKASNEALDNEEQLIDYREKNAKAGYVYVISNVGAFGEGVYKIGMTRRLDPQERVDELGDASVPFWFDIHALVFSENAPALEAKLHEHFAAGRINKVNGRKEFFRADLKDIEAVIRANYDKSVDVTHEAPAEQYRESLRMTMPSLAIQQHDHAAAEA